MAIGEWGSGVDVEKVEQPETIQRLEGRDCHYPTNRN